MDFKKLKQDGRRILIVGDIHGDLDSLSMCLDQLNWNKDTDLLISVGDLIDRGPKNHETLLFAKENMECVLGNHDSFMVDQITGYDSSLRTWMFNGGDWVTDNEEAYYAVARAVGSWMLALPLALEIELDSGSSIGVVHAELPTVNNDWDLFTRMLSSNHVAQSAIWGRTRIRNDKDNTIKGVKNLFVGHTVVPKPVLLGNIWYLDTGCVFYKNLSFAVIQPTGEQEIVTFHLQNAKPTDRGNIPFTVSK